MALGEHFAAGSGSSVSVIVAEGELQQAADILLDNPGIDSVSVNPDTVAYTRRLVASMEQKIILGKIRGE